MTDPDKNSLVIHSMRSIVPGNVGNIPAQAAISQYEKSDEANPDLVIAKTNATFHGIFDTGASCSVISERVAAQLALRKINTAMVHTAGGTVQQNCYVVNIVLPNKLVLSARQVTAANLHGFDVLLGMDIIGLGDFIISLRHGFLVVEFNLYAPYYLPQQSHLPY
jgi:predicted aspartyl protease